MTRPIGWDPDPLDALPPEPERRESRRWGCSVAVITLILALSGVPGVVAGGSDRLVGPAMSPRSGTPEGAAAVASDDMVAGWEPCCQGVDPGGPRGLAYSDDSSAPTGQVGTVLLGGFATWYATPGFTAAAGPALRDVLGDWRGRYVTVEAGDRSVVVQLTDWCACGERHGRSTLLDLSRKAFSALADPARGVIRVSIEIDGSPRPNEADDRMRVEDGGPALPQTDAL